MFVSRQQPSGRQVASHGKQPVLPGDFHIGEVQVVVEEVDFHAAK